MDAQPHTASYYAASAGAMQSWPQPGGTMRTRVCVIGGGFSGLSTALHLAERGLEVTLLEAHRIGWGASGRNGGQLISGMCEPEKFAPYGPEAMARVEALGDACNILVQDIIQRYDIDCDLTLGYFDAALKERELRDMRQRHALLQDGGVDGRTRIVERAELRSVIGSDRYIGGMLDDSNGHLHPLRLAHGLARAADSLGVRIHENSAVRRIETTTPLRVHTDTATVIADQVVLAGNAYIEGLAPGLHARVIPAGSYIIATEPLADALATELLPRNSAVCDQRSALDYFRLSADRRLLFGGLCNYSGRAPRDIAATLRPKMLRVFPQLASTAIEYQWGGMIGISIRRIPQIGQASPGLYYAQGYSGHGVAPSHMAGRIIADAITGDPADLDLFDQVRHPSIPGGRRVANAALALGMLWYRLLDQF